METHQSVDRPYATIICTLLLIITASGSIYADDDKSFRVLEPEMVRIPGGSFTMGNTNRYLYKNEAPAHLVHIKPFSIGRYEVTHEQWHSVTGTSPSRFRGCNSCPVEGVNWNEIRIYINKLNQITNKKYRLPTEAEWEYAARAGSTTKYHWGNLMRNNANCRFCGNIRNISKAVPVGSYPANNFGLFDMSGNVSEWVQDCWNENYQGAPTDGSAWIHGDCDLRIQRGGSYLYDGHGVTVSSRARGKKSTKGKLFIGFRIAHD